MRIVLMLLISCSFWLSVCADTIEFKDGRIIERDIISRDSRSITVDYYGESLTYFNEDIVAINGQPAGKKKEEHCGA